MIDQLTIFESHGSDPYWNLATEKYLLDTVVPGQCILYLWQNQNTVVIGRNQNPWVECRTALLEEEGGHLARRLSGGGAVFHDLGNLNFTFLVSTEDYDVNKQLSVIQQACAFAGIQTEKSGRNDVLANGSKFSGNAFYSSKGKSYHHGTLLISADMEKLQRYLSPSKAKLQAKGVTSVRSRVVNLQELAPELTIETMKQYMCRAFADVYGLQAATIRLTDDALANISETARQYSTWEYLYGTPLPFSFACEDKFDWGQFRLEIEAKGGMIVGIKAYSDAMDWQIAAKTEQALAGCQFSVEDMCRAMEAALDATVAADICRLLRQQNL